MTFLLMKFNTFIILTFISLTFFITCFIVQRKGALNLMLINTLEAEKEKDILLAKAKTLESILLNLSQKQEAVVDIPVIQNNNTVIILFTVFVVLGIILTCYYSAPGPIFCPIRTISQFDNLGNEILIGVRYPVESPVSAGIRLVGTPDVIPLKTFLKTVSENPTLKDASLNTIAPAVSKSGIVWIENIKIFIGSVLNFFF